MRWLIRRYQRRGRSAARFSDDVHYGEILTIGRGSDQSVQLGDLAVALEHARIVALGGGRFRVEALTLAGLRIDGAMARSAVVGVGARIDVGGHRLEIGEPPPDYDAALIVSALEEVPSAERPRALPTRLSETGLSKRRASWILFLAVGILGGLPAAAHFLPALDRFLRDRPWLPDRGLWDSGEIASAHRFFGQACEVCHERPFRMVRDAACLRCHAATPAHADPGLFALPALGDTRCAHCHREHNGPQGLVLARQSLCADCHLGLAARTGGVSALPDYGDFDTLHPEFRIDLPRTAEDGWTLASERVTWSPGLREGSGLRFPHDRHLDPRGIRGPEGTRRLGCGDCHQAEPGGARMQPIDFERHCQGCHRLAFDPTAPELEVPHARVPEILFTLEAFYARRALEGGVGEADAPASLRLRRRPGQPVSREEREEALAWARERARRVGESLFTGRACAVCHRVAPPRAPEEPWQVAPVRLAGVWYPRARFDHGSHTSFACGDCHAAAESRESADLLIPGSENCRGCHAGERPAPNRVASACIACHDYHLSGRPPLRL